MFARTARWAVDFLKRDEGPTAVEYAVMLALIIVVCVAAVTAIGTSTRNSFASPVLKQGLKATP